MLTSIRDDTLTRWTLPTRLRLAWLEWRAVGWPGSAALLMGAALAASSVTAQATAPANADFQMVVIMAATLALALGLIPTPHTDRAWELTALSAEPEGQRQWRSLAATLLLALLLLAVLAYALCPPYAPWTVWGWFAPRAAWFAAPVLLVLWRTGQPVFAARAVVGVYLIKYCPFPFALNPAVFFEPRLPLHALMAALLLVAFTVPSAWVRVSWPRRLGTGVLSGLLVLLPALPLQPQYVPTLQATTLPAGLIALDAPWAKLDVHQLSDLMRVAENSRKSFRVLSVHPEQGEPDGTELAQSLGIRRFPVLLDIRDGQARVMEWDWY